MNRNNHGHHNYGQDWCGRYRLSRHVKLKASNRAARDELRQRLRNHDVQLLDELWLHMVAPIPRSLRTNEPSTWIILSDRLAMLDHEFRLALTLPTTWPEAAHARHSAYGDQSRLANLSFFHRKMFGVGFLCSRLSIENSRCSN